VLKLRQVLGRTGETGLAAGDDRRYGVYLHGVAVLPVEGWDPKWIKDNIQPKLEGLSGGLGSPPFNRCSGCLANGGFRPDAVVRGVDCDSRNWRSACFA
jgi:hypothetical protein